MENYLKVMNKKRQTLQTVMGVVSITFEVQDEECRFTGECERWEDDRRITDTYEVFGDVGYLCNACGDTIDKFVPWPNEEPLKSKESFEAPEEFVLVPTAIGEREFFEAAKGWREYDISDSINNPEHARVIYGSFRAAVAKLGVKSVTLNVRQNDSVATIVRRKLRAAAPFVNKARARHFGGKPEVGPDVYSAHEILLPHEIGAQDPEHLHVAVHGHDPVTAFNHIKLYVENQPNVPDVPTLTRIVIHDDIDTVPQGARWYFPNEGGKMPYLLDMGLRKD